MAKRQKAQDSQAELTQVLDLPADIDGGDAGPFDPEPVGDEPLASAPEQAAGESVDAPDPQAMTWRYATHGGKGRHTAQLAGKEALIIETSSDGTLLAYIHQDGARLSPVYYHYNLADAEQQMETLLQRAVVE